MALGAILGAPAVPIGACVTAAVAASELGPEIWPEACRLGAEAATNGPSITAGAGAGATLAAVVDHGRKLWADAVYSLEMQACGDIP